jgi:quercetin dioxygenase-like cupin family protein
MEIGASVTNPRTGTRLTLLDYGDDSLSLRYESSAPTRTPDLPKHLHEQWVEEFEIVSGRGRYWIDGSWHDAKAGERLRHEPGNRHVHPMNTGDAPFEMVQTVTALTPDPDGIRDTFAVLFSLIDRHANGQATLLPQGYPVNPLYFAALGRVLYAGGSYDGTIPMAAQKLTAATIGRLAMALGVNPIDDKWR